MANEESTPQIQFGYCQCGCGGRTTPARSTHAKHGYIAGQPVRFIVGHNAIATAKPLKERFLERVAVIEDSTSCWLWTGGVSSAGYGQIMTLGRHTEGAHRVAWIFANGAIPEGLWVLHRCDNPPCVRPDHLFLGTPTDNAQDMIQKGRHGRSTPRGEASIHSVLTDIDVLAIRASSESAAMLAIRYAVHASTIRSVKRRATWRHI